MRRLIFMVFFACISSVFAADRVIDLNVNYKIVNFAEKNSKAIAVNQQIPAPTLHFKEGDRVTINVHNQLDEPTAIHWHGLILPWQMDGVAGVTQHAIPPGEVFQYQFTLNQSGTYWYHAHAELQEQQGLYGALIIDPIKKPTYDYNRDFTIVLSDWSNTKPNQILVNLKKSGDYYAQKFPLQPSLVKFISDYHKASTTERKQIISDYKMMQQMRMSLYDFSDVAYDAFLLNGRPNSAPWMGEVKIGDVVRLRFIGAGGSTIFHVKIPGSSMQMVHVQGNDVKPYQVDEFTIAPGETYDVLVKIQKNKPYIIYAESRDTLGAAFGALITKSQQSVNFTNIAKFPEPLPVTRDMMDQMMNGMHHSMSHDMSMEMPTEPTVIGDTMTKPSDTYTTSADSKYQNLNALVKTNDPNKVIAETIKMELFGYMGRYIWFINGLPEYKAKPIVLDPGKRYRIVFTNTSMMHHPMHIHGHWFILRKGLGAYDPLLHTIDVAPGTTMTADVDTDASGQWLLHCHLLYHMMSGMARIVQYSTLLEIIHKDIKPEHLIKKTQFHNRPIVRVDEIRPIDPMLVNHPMPHQMKIWGANLLDVGEDPVTNTQRLTFRGLYGSDYNKLELFTNDAEIRKGQVENADLDIFYWHLISQFWALKGGINYFYRPATKPYWQPGIGAEGLLPYFIETDIRGYAYKNSLKLDLELSRDTQFTNNFFVKLAVRSILASKTVVSAGLGAGLNQLRYIIKPYYRLTPGLNLAIEFEHEQDCGAFKRIQKIQGDAVNVNTLTFGLAALF